MVPTSVGTLLGLEAWQQRAGGRNVSIAVLIVKIGPGEYGVAQYRDQAALDLIERIAALKPPHAGEVSLDRFNSGETFVLWEAALKRARSVLLQGEWTRAPDALRLYGGDARFLHSGVDAPEPATSGSPVRLFSDTDQQFAARRRQGRTS